MNRQTFFTLGGALLASTALTGGAMAGTGGTFSGSATATVFSSTSIKVANTLFSTTAATADTITIGGAEYIGVSFCPTCNIPSGTSFNIEVTFTGAAPTNVTPGSTALLTRSGTASFSGTINGTDLGCTAAFAVGSTIFVNGCHLTTSSNALVGGVLFSGLQFTTANGLASVGATVSLTGRLFSSTGSTFDTFTGTVVTAAAPVVAQVVPANNVIIAALSTPNAFTYLQDPQAGTYSNNGVYTLTLAAINLSQVTGVKSADLAADVANVGTAVSSLNITVSSGLLNTAGATVALYNATPAVVTSVTTAAFSSGTITFTVNQVAVAASDQYTVRVTYDGTTQIPSALAAGSVTAKFGTQTAYPQAVPTATGTTATAARGGFNGELNGLYSSAISKLYPSAYNSYVRIHNNGVVAGAATITVRHDATGVAIGSFTSSSIAAGATLQLSAADLETGAGVTSSAIELYTIQVTGPFIGYVQHVVFNPATGQINDMSSFRNAGATIGNP